MGENPLRQVEQCGQAVWNDFIRRTFVENGDLKRLVDEDGLTGVTSNPTIFEKAIGGSSDYDGQLKELVDGGCSSEEIFQNIAAKDVQMAADVLRPVYDRTAAHDGYVSIEVSPDAAHDTEKTLEDAHILWKLVDRPNTMIKVPATPEGIPAIEQLIAEGINVNITLIFAVEVYEEVMEAYLRGLERRVEQNQPIDRIASVASFFVSRVDTLVDSLLTERAKGADEATRGELHALEGKAAIANAKIAYERFEQVFAGARWERLAAKGGQVQRPLWASTSTKNPNYPDTYYVTNLVGEETVNTMPPQTITAVRDHGQIECATVKRDVRQAHEAIERLTRVGINMTSVTSQLTKEGVKSFSDSLVSLFSTLEQKSALVIAGEVGRESERLDGQQSAVESTFKEMGESSFLSRLWDKDPSLWKPKAEQQSEITDRLGWLHVSECMLEHKNRFSDIARTVREAGYTHAVVLGMGGSSLAPYVLASSFGRQEGFPELLVLDSTDPVAIRDVERAIDIGKTLFIVSTKSGGTTETLSFFRTFWERVHKIKGDEAGEQFIAVTDPGTSLVQLARDHNFHDCFLNPSDIGGRYSALSFFGLVPAAVMGVDVEKLVDRAMGMEQACAPSVPPDQNPGARLGAIMGDLAKAGHDKVTFFLSPGIETLGLWLEQLLAESTGKEGKGLIPVPDNPPGQSKDYADDRLFVYIRLDSAENSDLDSKVESLERSGKPTVRLQMTDHFDLGAEFFRWEFATAVAGALLGINAFDQPNVQESKDNTKRLLDEYLKSGSLPEPQSVATADDIALYVNDAARDFLGGQGSSDLSATLNAFFSRVKAPEYLAIMAYIAPSPGHEQTLEDLRIGLRDALRVATTVGYGPRFLHSTGQLHKGGTPEGVYLQITADADQDVQIPAEQYSFETLIKAQALGDFESLQQHGRPAIRIHIPDESDNSLERLVRLVQDSVSAQTPAVS